MIPWDGESKTAPSHLISAKPFPRPNAAGDSGKWERNITFPFRLRGMWQPALMVFTELARCEADQPFFLLKQECRLVN